MRKRKEKAEYDVEKATSGLWAVEDSFFIGYKVCAACNCARCLLHSTVRWLKSGKSAAQLRFAALFVLKLARISSAVIPLSRLCAARVRRSRLARTSHQPRPSDLQKARSPIWLANLVENVSRIISSGNQPILTISTFAFTFTIHDTTLHLFWCLCYLSTRFCSDA